MEQHYELMYIVKSRLGEDELAKVKEKVRELIERSQARLTRQDDWGKRRLAYPIKRERFGFYELLEFDLESRKLSELDRSLRLTPNLLRYQILQSAFKTDEEREAEARRLEEVEARQRAREEAVRREEEAKTAAPSEAEAKRAKEKEEKKITLEELDEKLEEILKEDV